MKRYVKASQDEIDYDVLAECKILHDKLYSIYDSGVCWSKKEVTQEMIDMAQSMLDVVGAEGSIELKSPNNPRKRKLENRWDYYRMTITFTLGNVSDDVTICANSNKTHTEWEEFIARLLSSYYKFKTGRYLKTKILLYNLDKKKALV